MVETNDSVIVTAKLTKVFRDFWLRAKVTAVADLDLQIDRKEVFGLLGPNGSGKSTTLKMILGLLFPTRGRVLVFGRRPTDVPTKARIGFLPEESYLYPFLDARETLDFYGRLFHQPRRQRRFGADDRKVNPARSCEFQKSGDVRGRNIDALGVEADAGIAGRDVDFFDTFRLRQFPG